MGEIRLKRVYDTPSPTDGWRILADRLWPRGVSKEKIDYGYWAKAIAPSDNLRRNFHNGNITDEEFESEYRQEIRENKFFPTLQETILVRLETENVTLMTAAQIIPHGHVEVLREELLRGKREPEAE